MTKKLMMVAALIAAVAFAQTGNAMAQTITPSGFREAQVLLNLDSGEVSVDIGSEVAIFTLVTSNTSGFFDNAAAEDALLELELNFMAGVQNDSGGIGVLALPELPTGFFNLGPVIPDGSRSIDALTEAGFEFFFDGVGFESAINRIGDPAVILAINGEVIPEPSSFSLFALASLGAIARRRR